MSEKNRASIGDRLRQERERVGLSQDAFATGLGVTRRTQVAWERGDQVPNAEALGLAHALGIDVLYVLVGQRSVPIESTLSPEKKALLENYDAADEEGRAAARRVLSSLAQPRQKAA